MGGRTAEVAVSLPSEVRAVLNTVNIADPPPGKIRFRIGKLDYYCRVFLLRAPNELYAQPLLGLRFHREMSTSDAVRMLGKRYSLTDREQEALEAVANGLTSKEAAKHMKISPNTVKSFMRAVMLKIGVGSRAGVIGKLLAFSNDSAE